MARRITVRRSVPFDLDGGRRLTINDMQPDPDRALLVVVGPGGPEQVTVHQGDEVRLAERDWRVVELVVGERGSVELVGDEA